MKVACIFNMNNNLFALTRYLRDRGIDAHMLLLNNEVPHFHPACDTYTLDYQDYTHTLEWGSFDTFTKTLNARICDDLKDYDFIIGCALVPAFLNLIGRRIDIFTPFGGDLYYLPIFRFENLRTTILDLLRFSAKQNQASGIKKARFINTDSDLEVARKILEKLKVEGNVLNIGVPMLHTPTYNPENIEIYYDRSYWYKEFKAIREAHDLVIFHHARHVWKNPPDSISCKSNDKLIKGFADFLKKTNSSVKACLVMCEYGPDVLESKRLISQLEIEKNVRWFPQMFRKDIMIGIHLSDIGCGDFEAGSLLGGVNCEVLAMAKPYMHYRNDMLYKDNYPVLYPLINVYTASDICNALTDYLDRPKFYIEMGEQGRLWLQKYAIDDPVDEYVKIIQSH